MKRLVTLAAALLVSFSSAALAQEKISLNATSAYLNGFKTAQSTFVQYNEDGSRSTGTLYIKRPGRMRFEYDPPDGGIVIAGGSTVVVHDKKSNQPPESYPLSRTPLSIILARQVNLGRANMVTGHGTDGELTIVRAQDPEHPEAGSIDLKFADNPVRLSQWIITNENGQRTAVVLNGLETGQSLSDGIFNPNLPGRRVSGQR